MTAGFFQAILEFSKMQVGENLEAINLSDSLFYFKTKDNFTFIIRIEKTSPFSQSVLKTMLTQLSERFFEKFPSADKWDGNLSYFEGFSPICDAIISSHSPPKELTLPQDGFPEQPLIPISTVIVEEASKKLCALVENGNTALKAKKYRQAKENYDSAIGFLVLMPELVPHYPNLKDHLAEQIKRIEKLLAAEISERKVISPPKEEPIARVKPAPVPGAGEGILVDFHGARIFQSEADVLIALEQQVGKPLQHVVEVVWDSIGFTAEEGHVQQLGLYKLDLAVLPSKIGELAHLQVLFADDNRLTAIPDFLSQLPSLEKLSLASNRLQSLPELVGNLQSLRVLLLRWNKLKNLPQNLPNTLEIIDLRYNQLSTLPETIGTLRNLQQLAIDFNQLTFLPQTIGNLQSLQKLTLNTNQLSSLPPSIGNLQNLQHLEINGNKLETLPDSFADLGSLEYLDLGYNLLVALPENFGNLGALQNLMLIHNQLNYLPDSLGNLLSLRELCLSFNKLKDLPPSMGNLSSLENLDLRGNPIERLPSCMTELKTLQTLYLGWDLLRDPITQQLASMGVKILEDL